MLEHSPKSHQKKSQSIQSLQSAQNPNPNLPNQATLTLTLPTSEQTMKVNEMYEKLMGQVGEVDLGDLRKGLEVEGIGWSWRFQREMRFNCVRTDWESTIYQVKYGNFSALLKVIYLTFKSQILCGPASTSGSFGQVLLFQLSQSNKYAIKSIKLRQVSTSSIESALKQVFIAKICSGLKVAPKFKKTLSYDAIIFQDCLQFCMQICQTSPNPPILNSQPTKKTLLPSLKILHNFHICHMDIKNDNIAWSPSFGKLVFLDFGFSQIVGEGVGYRTRIRFRGSFRYCSPQMKRLFYLKEEKLVDLYFNDLWGLVESWGNMGNMGEEVGMGTEMFSMQMNVEKSMSTNYQAIHNQKAFIRFLALKFNLFTQNYQLADKQLNSQQELLQTFTTILQNFLSSSQPNQSLSSHPHHPQPPHLHLLTQTHLSLIHRYHFSRNQKKPTPKIDTFLLENETNKKNRFPVILYNQIVEASGNDGEFLRIWDTGLWKEEIFFFVDVYTSQPGNRQKLVEKIYRRITNSKQSQKLSYTMKYRQVLLHYLNYFTPKKNLQILQKILTYFLLLKDNLNRQKTEQIILNLWKQEQKYLQFLQENFKYFVGKVAVLDPEQQRFLGKSVRNLEDFLGVGAIDGELLVNAKKLIRCMKIIKKIFKKFSLRIQIKPKLYQQLHQSASNPLITPQCHKFLTTLLSQIQQQSTVTAASETQSQKQIQRQKQRQKQRQIQLPTYPSFYLQKCTYQTFLKTSIKTRCQKHSLKKLLETENFFREFLVMENFYVLNSRKETDLYLRNVICEDIRIMFHQQGYLLNIKYLRILVENFGIGDAEVFSVGFVEDICLGAIGSVEQIMVFKSMLIVIVTVFLTFKYGHNTQISKPSSKKLSNLILTFLKFTENPQTFTSTSASTQHNNHNNSNHEHIPKQTKQQSYEYCEDSDDSEDKQHQNIQYAHSHKILKIFSFLLDDREVEIFQDVLGMLEDGDSAGGLNGKNKTQFFYCILCLSGRTAGQKYRQRFIQATLNHNKTLLQTHQLLPYIYFPKYLQLILQTYRTTNQYNSALECLTLTLHLIHWKSQPITLTQNYLIMIRFIQMSSREELLGFLGRELGTQGKEGKEGREGRDMRGFCQVVGLTFLLAVAEECLGEDLGQEMGGRLLRVCLMFGACFCGEYFEKYKVSLYYGSYMLKKSQNKHTKIRHKRKLAYRTESQDQFRNFSLYFKPTPNKSERKQTTESLILAKLKQYVRKAIK